MSNGSTGLALRAIEVHATRAKLQTAIGPSIPHYAMTLDTGRVYQFIVGNTDADDGINTLAPSGGTIGRWKIIDPLEATATGADLGDGNATIVVAAGLLRTLPVGTLTGSSVLTLGDTGATVGQLITITRLDVGAFTYTIDNGGAGGGTLAVMPVSVRAWGDFRFDGTNWTHLRSALAL